MYACLILSAGIWLELSHPFFRSRISTQPVTTAAKHVPLSTTAFAFFATSPISCFFNYNYFAFAMPNDDILTDDYVAGLLAKEASDCSIKYSAMGMEAFNANSK